MKKYCNKCKQEKNIEEFYNFNRAKDGKCCFCKKCDNTRKTILLRKKSIEEGKVQRNYTLDARKDRSEGIKYCPHCKVKKPVSEFLYNNAARDKVDFFCVECKRILSKKYDKRTIEEKHAYYLKRKRKMRNLWLIKKYGITIEQYEKKLLEQNNKCEICGMTSDVNGKLLSVDHNHKTGDIRGLLCNNCNVAVGFVHESVEKAKSLMEYLTKYLK